MTMDQSKRDLPSSDAALQTVLGLTRDGKHGEALKIYDELFHSGASTQDLFKGAAQSVVSAIIDGSILTDWPDTRRIALYRRLILQPKAFGEPPELHFQIASNHSSGNGKILEKAASELTSTLSALWTEGNREHGFLLMALLLRRHLRNWRSQAAISRWHLELLPSFNISDMSIPYNTMFDKQNFARNVDDLSDLLQTMPTTELCRRFAPWQIVLFHWITGGRHLDSTLPDLVVSLQRTMPTAPRTAADIAAIRSLTLRLAALGHNTEYLEEDLQLSATQWSVLHKSTEKSTMAGRAEDRLQSKIWQGINATLDVIGRKAPFLRIGRRSLRVAVCISGQLRGYQRAFPSWHRSFLRGVDCHYFVHTWKAIGRSGAEPFRAYLPFSGQSFCEAYRNQAHRVGMNEIMARYPRLFTHLKQGGVVSSSELRTFYGTDHIVLEDDGDTRFADWSNSRKMHYKIAAAQDLLGDQQDEFDLVLRIRPDKELGLAAFAWSDILAAAANPVIFADTAFGHQYTWPLIGDQVGIGAPKVMAVYADTFRLAPFLAEHGLFHCLPELQGHTSLAQTCWHAGISVKRLPVRMSGLLEADTMSIQEISACLEQDSNERMDHIDQILLSAAQADLDSALTEPT